MTRSRATETGKGIQGESTVRIYDQMQRRLRDKGWIEAKDIIRYFRFKERYVFSHKMVSMDQYKA